jgi:hypothetical protein
MAASYDDILGTAAAAAGLGAPPEQPALRPTPHALPLPNETSQLAWPLPWASQVMQGAEALAAAHAREVGAQHAALAQARSALAHGSAVVEARAREEEAERSLLASRCALLGVLQGCLGRRRAELAGVAQGAAQWEGAAVQLAEEAQRESYAAWGEAEVRRVAGEAPS